MLITSGYRPAAVVKAARSLLVAATCLVPLATLANTTGGAQTVHAAPTLIGRTDAARTITLALHLPSQDPANAAAFVRHVGAPGDALFRHYLTPEEYAARFGARQADYDAAISWAKFHGLTVGEHYTSRTILPVTGPASSLEAAFGVTFNDYRDQTGRTFYKAVGTPRMPAELAGRVAGVLGFSSQAHYVPYVERLPAGAHTLESGTGPDKAFSASDLRTAYRVPSQSFGPKQVLGVFEQGGFEPGDVSTYVQKNNLPAVPVKPVAVNGSGIGISDPGVELEAVLDIDMQIAMNPTAKQILVYEDATDAFPVAIVNALSAMASDNKAQTISISYGADEVLQGADAMNAENTVLTQLAAQGQAVFASAGDNGAYGEGAPGLNVSDPSSQPLVTGVGGTTLFTAAKQIYETEEVWNVLGNGSGATGGGISTQWPLPSYQAYTLYPGGPALTVVNGGSATMRNVPDVASVGNPYTGVAVYSKMNGGWFPVGGTSVSAPLWAGYYSLANAASEGLGFGALGFANPAIYNIGVNGGHLYPDFNDIEDGSNGNVNLYGIAGFNAGPSYDNATGMGSFFGTDLLADLVVLPTNANSNPPPPPNGLKANATSNAISLSWTGSKGDAGFVVLAYDYSYTFVPVAFQLVTVHTANLTGLKPNTTYTLNVVAIAAGGTTISAPDIVTTPKAQ